MPFTTRPAVSWSTRSACLSQLVERRVEDDAALLEGLDHAVVHRRRRPVVAALVGHEDEPSLVGLELAGADDVRAAEERRVVEVARLLLQRREHVARAVHDEDRPAPPAGPQADTGR